jgi:tRNA threonylcarbamoyladenosine biosynthesis protein TsaB
MAIETSCRRGGVAVGDGERVLACKPLGATGKHARDLLAEMRDALAEAGAAGPETLDELYVSAGPGSFTGLRVGVTVARTMGQAMASLKIAAVPTALVVAEAYRDADIEQLVVLLAAREQTAHATRLTRDGAGEWRISEPGRLLDAAELADAIPGPIHLAGEALEFLDLPERDDLHITDRRHWLPSAESVWRVGRRLAERGEFTPWTQLQPIYARRPEALRLWAKLHGEESIDPGRPEK